LASAFFHFPRNFTIVGVTRKTLEGISEAFGGPPGLWEVTDVTIKIRFVATKIEDEPTGTVPKPLYMASVVLEMDVKPLETTAKASEAFPKPRPQ
jgi:hypothetical protein